MVNRFPGKCFNCATWVVAGSGSWTPQRGCACSACVKPAAPAAAAPAVPTIEVTLAGSDVRLAPMGYLGGDLFARYRAAVGAARYEASDKTQRCSPAIAAAIVPRLIAAGFAVEATPDARAAIEAGAATIVANVGAANARVERIDAQLKARGLALFPFQRSGVAWLASRSGALLADEMGLGKTIQALAALPDGAPTLVVCPAVAKGVWLREASKWRPELRVSVLAGRGSFRWPAPGEMVIVNYDILSDAPGTAPEGCVLVCDEAHAVKSSKSARGKRVRELSKACLAARGRAWALTATPLLNRPGEMYAVLSAFGIAREAFTSWDGLVELFNGHQDTWGGWHWGQPSAEVPDRLRRVSLRRERRDVLPELPRKSWQHIPVELEPSVLRQLDRLALDVDSDAAADALIAQGLAGRAMPSFEKISAARALLAKAKIKALEAIVEDYEAQDEPLVVFSAHRAPIDALKAREGWAVITGDESPAKRTEIEERFQRGELRGIGATIAAGGVAITLVRACQAVFVDQAWNGSLNAQAEDRICRIGQTRPVVIKVLVADHGIDKRVAELLAKKARLVAGSIEASRRTGAVEIEIPVLDLSALAERSAKAAAEAEADARDAEERLAAGKARRAENVAKNASEKRARAAAARKARLDEHAAATAAERRLPSTPREAWMAAALAQLVADDPDHAGEQNGIGFAAADTYLGHDLAFFAETYGLTNDEWATVAALCRKYHGQVGRFEADAA